VGGERWETKHSILPSTQPTLSMTVSLPKTVKLIGECGALHMMVSNPDHYINN